MTDGADASRPDDVRDDERASGSGAEDVPLGELARKLRERRARRREADDPFEEIAIDRLDPDAVWTELLERDEPGETGERGSTVAANEGAEPLSGDHPEHVIPKREFCQRCRYFAAPPETRCTHRGTEIVEVVDFEHFAVRACPIVEAERLDTSEN
jgi:hypothetical protein